MNKSEGVKDIVKWMEEQIKAQQAKVESARRSRAIFGMYEDCGPSYCQDYTDEKAKLDQMVSWKISTEKYMKKLRHQGE